MIHGIIRPVLIAMSIWQNSKAVLLRRKAVNANANVPAEAITPAMAAALADEVFARLTRRHDIITTAEVRACVSALLGEKGLTGTAKSYMDYVK